MKRWIPRILKIAKVLMVLGQIVGAFYAIGGVVSSIFVWSVSPAKFFSRDDVLILDGIVKLPEQALQHFPFHLFISLYCVSIVLTGAVIYLGAKVLWQVFDNLLSKQYFTDSNRLLLKNFLKVQVLSIFADIMAAIPNDLASTQLHRTPAILYSMSDWESEIYGLIILVIIYYIFTKGLALKNDADLTI